MPSAAAPRRNRNQQNGFNILTLTRITRQIKVFCQEFFTRKNLWDLTVQPQKCLPMAIILFILEFFINFYVISYVKYTEIDWIAYMQEVEGVKNGTWDYSQLKGDTGPLVYPAGFVWIYLGLYYITDFGTYIKLAQCLFAVLYLINLALVFRLMVKSEKIPPYTLAIMCLTSKRVHSIFVLRLFNDPVAMMFLYASLNLFASDYWSLGSLVYSMAVSIKMNILLFAPALLFAYIFTQGYFGTLKQLAICASFQLIVALPFLYENPINYINGSFDFGRVFMHKWTVNWRFVPECLFVHKGFHYSLLALHILLVAFSIPLWAQLFSAYAKLKESGKRPSNTIQLFLLPLFMSNFIGICVARSLHYQFYIWYYHQLPYLLWCTSLPDPWVKLLILGLIELCWNTYPSQNWSSATLHVCHLVLLVSLFLYMWKISAESKKNYSSTDDKDKNA